MPIIDLISVHAGKMIFDSALGYIKSQKLLKIIDDIYNSIFKVYDDIKICSMLSAEQAIESAYKSPAIKKGRY